MSSVPEARRWLPDRIRENLLPKLDQAGIGFSVEVCREAVEAYMTRRLGDEHDFYKPENSREDLQERNPALFEYVRSLFEGGARQAGDSVGGLWTRGAPRV